MERRFPRQHCTELEPNRMSTPVPEALCLASLRLFLMAFSDGFRLRECLVGPIPLCILKMSEMPSFQVECFLRHRDVRMLGDRHVKQELLPPVLTKLMACASAIQAPTGVAQTQRPISSPTIRRRSRLSQGLLVQL